MSAINNMIKEMDQKKVLPQKGDLSAKKTQKKPDWFRRAVWSGLIIVLCIILGVWWYSALTPQNSAVSPLVARQNMMKKENGVKDFSNITSMAPVPNVKTETSPQPSVAPVVPQKTVAESKASTAPTAMPEAKSKPNAQSVAVESKKAIEPLKAPVVPVVSSDNAVKKAVALSPDEQAQQAFEVVLIEYQKGQGMQAISDMRTLQDKFPNYLPVRVALIKYYLQSGQYTLAQQSIDIGLMNAPQSTQLVQLKAQLLYLQNQTPQALALLKSQSPDMKSNMNYYLLEANLLLLSKDAVNAAHLYQGLLAINSEDAQYWLGYALALEAQNKKNAAMSAYQQLLNSNNVSQNIRMFALSKVQALSK